MKKFISALLVVMMLVSMIPATVFAAAETFSYDFSTFSGSSTQYAEETHALSNDVTLYMKGCHINQQLRVYGSQSGQFAIFKADSKPISAITVNAGYKADSLVVSGSNDNGTSWTELAKLTTSTSYKTLSATFASQYKWVKLTVSGNQQIRVQSISLTLNPAATVCTHANTYEDGYVAPDCTTEGKSAAIICFDCGETVTASTTIAASGHNFVSGTCTACGAKEAATATATITFDDTAKRTTYTTTQQVWEENSITVTNDKAGSTSNVGDYANPARFYKSSTVTVAFPMNITQIVFDCNTNDYATALAASITGATASGKKVTVVLTTPATSFTTGAMSAQVRVDSLTVTHEVEAGVCLHEETELQGYVAPTCTTVGATGNTVCVACGEVLKESETLPVSHEGFETYVEDYIAPTCTEPGETGITYCSNCDEVVAENEAIPAAGHKFDGDTCTVCGNTVAVVEEETYVFSNYPAGTQYAKNEEHVLSDLVTMITDTAHFTTQLRLYSSSTNNSYAIIQSQLPIKSITVNAGYNADTLQIFGSNDNGATWTLAAEIVVNNSTYTDYSASLASTPYTWLKLDVKGTQQVRLQNMTLQFVTTSSGDCDHSLTVTIPGTAATCTTDGQEDTLTCACGQNVQEGAVIPSPGHSYDDDYCAVCNSINPEAANQAEAIDGLPENGDKVIFYYHSGKVAMAAAPNNDRMGAVNVAKANGMIPYSATHTAVMTVEKVGEYFRFEMNGQYLTSGEKGNTLCFAALPAEGETDLTLWAITQAATYTWGVNIRSVNATYNGTDYNQTIEYYNNQFYPYGFNGTNYTSSFQLQIGVVSRKPAVVEMDGVPYTSFEEAYAYDPDTTIKLLTDFEEINVSGDLYLDLNGFTVGSATANAIFAGDSSATATAAGTGSLTTTSEVIVDNKIGDTRYIALKDENGVYTFHVLDLKLENVTLRTNKAGIYYKASMACDEILAAQIECYGVAVSIVGMPTADFANEENTVATQMYGAPEGIFTSGSITNIFRDGLSAEKNAARGEMAIYANPYIQLHGETVLMGSNSTSRSMKDVMDYLNTNYASLEADEQENVKAFYTQWADTMAAWNLANLEAAILPSDEEQA